MQLAYNFNPAVATPGEVAEYREGNIIISKVAKNAVPVGLLCAPGPDAEVGPSQTTADPNSANPGQVIALPSGLVTDPMPDSVWVGIPIYDSSRPPYDPTNSYSDKDPCPVMRKGVIWVQVWESVTQYGDVYVWTGGTPPATGLGTFAGAAGAGKVKFPRGRWLTSATVTTGSKLAVLELW